MGLISQGRVSKAISADQLRSRVSFVAILLVDHRITSHRPGRSYHLVLQAIEACLGWRLVEANARNSEIVRKFKISEIFGVGLGAFVSSILGPSTAVQTQFM